MLTGCHACEPLDAVLKLLWQRFVAQGRIHSSKPLTQPIPIRATEPWFVLSERTGQQLHRTPGGLDSRRTHVDPQPVVLNPLHKSFSFSL